MDIGDQYLESIRKQFSYYKSLGEKAMDQLEEGQLFQTFNEDTNSIALIVKHLHGNMLSRWTDFLTTDGEKEWRNRDAEFINDIMDSKDLIQKWNKGWSCLFNTLNSLCAVDLSKIIYIRNEGHTVVEAVNRQLAHYSYHIGQIIYAAKLLKSTEWKSLSIPRNRSNDFNQVKFSKEKQRRHFTDDE